MQNTPLKIYINSGKVEYKNSSTKKNALNNTKFKANIHIS